MILSPFDLTLFAPIAALIPPRIQEPAVAMDTPFAERLAGFGFYPMIHVLPVIGPDCARGAAEIAAIALNRLCGFDAAATQHGPMADAAE